MISKDKKTRKNSQGITLIALVIMIIILLILASISIALLTGENGLVTKAKEAEKATKISKYYEKIELIREEVRLDNKDYTPATLDQLQDKFNSDKQADWVKKTDREVISQEDTIILETKEGYIFNVTELDTRYVADTKGSEGEVLSVVAKNIDTETCIRKTDLPFADLFEIKWGKGGSKIVEYIVDGNLNFKQTEFNSKKLDNLADLELGTYTITCKITQNNQSIEDNKMVKVTELAITEVMDAGNKGQKANAIYSEYDLYYFSELMNNGNMKISNNVKLMNEIDLSKVCGTKIGNWKAIGNNSHRYSGIFDGDGNKIDHIYIDSDEAGKGLFGYIENARISNITLENGSISARI